MKDDRQEMMQAIGKALSGGKTGNDKPARLQAIAAWDSEAEPIIIPPIEAALQDAVKAFSMAAKAVNCQVEMMEQPALLPTIISKLLDAFYANKKKPTIRVSGQQEMQAFSPYLTQAQLPDFPY